MAIATPGHTPGHTSVQIASVLASFSVRQMLLGNRAVSFQHPDWRVGFDLDLDQGAKTRRAFLDRCASEKGWSRATTCRSPALAMLFAPEQRSTASSDWRWEVISRRKATLIRRCQGVVS